MAISRQKKIDILASLTKGLTNSLAGVFVSFKGLTVAEVNALRDELKKDKVRYTVVKKTLLKRALQDQGIQGDQPALPGEVAFAYLSAEASAKADPDITAPARGLQAFVKKYKEKLAFLGGYLEGKYLSLDETKSVAAIPPVNVLRGMFANIINSPIRRIAIALGEVAKAK